MITKKCLDFSWPSSMLMCSRVLVEVTALSVKLGAVLEPYLSSRQADSDISLTSFWLWCSSLTTRMDLMRLSINIAMHTTKNTPVAQIEKNTGKFLYITVCSWLFIWMWLSLGIWIFLIWLFFFLQFSVKKCWYIFCHLLNISSYEIFFYYYYFMQLESQLGESEG